MISAILEIMFQASRLVTLISVSLHLHDVFSYLGDIVSSFEARNLERASRSNAYTGFIRDGGFMLRSFGAISGHLGSILGPSWGHIEAISGHLRAILGPSWAILWPSWAILGPRCDF